MPTMDEETKQLLKIKMCMFFSPAARYDLSITMFVPTNSVTHQRRVESLAALPAMVAAARTGWCRAASMWPRERAPSERCRYTEHY